MAAALFFGGWRGPWSEQYPLLGLFYSLLKSWVAYLVVIWVRGSLPRIRIDHMLAFNWKFLTPVALATVVVTAVVDKLIPEPASRAILDNLPRAGILFLANVALAAVIVWALSAYVRRQLKLEAGEAEFEAPALAHAPEAH